VSVKVPARPKRQSIELDGMFGKFFIGSGDFVVHYFSTFASPNSDHGGNEALLKELAPMRERVKASEMKSLDALLQRDLSDERIALELIPYLEGKFSKVGFFPPVLSVLMPKGFISGGDNPGYPKPEKKSEEFRYSYGCFWELTAFPAIGDGGEEESRLGRLRIYLGDTDLIVLDGQHRSNAFRYVANQFEVDDAYQPFYEGVEKFESYNSDLPVTIIWFESNCDEDVRPTDISKELFVAVNNSAKTVSESRTVLLDETSATSLAVNSLYNWLADTTSFDNAEMSLLTTAFDSASENIKPAMAVTNPSKLNDALVYSFFANSGYDSLKDRAQRHKQTNADRFVRIMGSPDLIDIPEIGMFKVSSKKQRNAFRQSFEKNYRPALALMLSELPLLEPHFSAIDDVTKWLGESETAPEYATVWKNIFCGGEGLYHAYMTSSINGCRQYAKYIRKIDEKFRQYRFERVKKKNKSLSSKDVNYAFRVFDTVAFQTGFLMALGHIYDNYYYPDHTFGDAIVEIGDELKKKALPEWIYFLLDYKQLVVGDSMDPNDWPLFQKMVLRLLDQSYEEIFESPRLTPDAVVIKRRLKTKIEVYYETNENVPGEEELKVMCSDVVDSVQAVGSKIGVALFKKATLKRIAVEEARGICLEYEV